MRPFAHPLARRSLLMLAIMQMMVITIAPLHDQGELGGRGPVRIERLHTNAGAPAHDPDTCALCRAMHLQFLRSTPTSLAVTARAAHRPVAMIVALPATRAPPSAHLTRAPPTPLA